MSTVNESAAAAGQPVSLVMVAYNEADHIEQVLREYVQEIYERLPAGSEFIVYLDKPTDATDVLVKKWAEKYRLTVLEGEVNVGYAIAMKRALHRTRNRLVFYSDSSGKHAANDFWQLLPYSEHYDIVSGWRKWRSDPYVRRVISFLQQVLVVVFFGLPLHDYNTGFKILRRRVIEDVLDDCRYTKQSFSTELLIRAFRKGYTIKSVPVVFRARTVAKTGTRYSQLPGIIAHSLHGLFLLWWEGLVTHS